MIGWRRSPAQRLTIEILSRQYAEFDEADQIPEVVDALKHEAFRPLAKKTLIRLFPLLDVSSAGLISEAQYAILHRALFECDAAFTVAVLIMLVAIGDTGAIEHVERLSKGGGCLGRQNPVVHEVAMRCLELLVSAS